MTMMKWMGAGMMMFLLTGCSLFGGGDQDDQGQTATTGSNPDVVDVGTYSSGGSRGGQDLGGAGSGVAEMTEEQLRANNVVYFDFDQSRIRPEGRTALIAHAGFLARNMGSKVLLAGHADERGTREYNMALGEKRSIAVRNFLLANGVRNGQLETVSYGEEKPADLGSGEQAWSQNRRVELLYD